MKAPLLHKILFGIVAVGLFLPLIQTVYPLKEVGFLWGAVTPAEEPRLSKEAWFSGHFTQEMNTYLNENFGFRNDLVRLHNQVAFDLFHEAKANGVIIGKENYLYEIKYIKSYLGDEEIKYDRIDSTVRELTALQEVLAEEGKLLVVVMAPGKASFYPEYIPDEYQRKSDTNYYGIYQKRLKENGVNIIDFGSYFREMKGKTPAPLYPKTGIHWSQYGALLATDSMIHYFQEKLDWKLNELSFDRVHPQLTTQMQSVDDDVCKGMNLMREIPPLPMAYPPVEYNTKYSVDMGGDKPRMLVISDSFFWNIFGQMELAPSIFEQIDFLFYNTQWHTLPGRQMTYTDPLSVMHCADEADIIVVMANECNLDNIGWGFTTTAYDYYVAGKKVDSFEKRVRKYLRLIKGNGEWMHRIRIKAIQNGKFVSRQLQDDAEYMAKTEL